SGSAGRRYIFVRSFRAIFNHSAGGILELCGDSLCMARVSSSAAATAFADLLIRFSIFCGFVGDDHVSVLVCIALSLAGLSQAHHLHDDRELSSLNQWWWY